MSEITFEMLPLAAPIQQALADKGYTQPSPIQAQSIPVLLEGRDLMACAQTGTGKTASFALPILHRLTEIRRRPERHEVRSLILTPTRELAVQVADSFRTYGKNMRFSIGLVHGGVSQYPQVKALNRGLDVLVATPGRLVDLYEQGHVDLSGVGCFVLDEADRMLDMGFIHDIRKIADELPEDRQTVFFSATMAPTITKLANSLLDDPEEIRIAPKVTTAEKITQSILFVQQEDKHDLLLNLLNTHFDETEGELSLVFSRTRHGARKLAEKLNRKGIRADAIHGDKTQAARQKTLDRFRDGRTPVLVATDVAARGIDVKNITLVINFDLPQEADNYVHRIGRTARAGESGRAVSFCSGQELPLLRDVERLIKQSVPVDKDHEHHAEGIANRYNKGGTKGGGGGSFNKSNKKRRFGNRNGGGSGYSKNGGGKSYGRGGSASGGKKPNGKRNFNRGQGGGGGFAGKSKRSKNGGRKVAAKG
ncbi:DEAD/DEAH box helicase [Rubellicoccus peritrichatus]|uniref:DEAD-box ATP-dependent RNA helicase RhpA n=1 Tax=Rubellicoccus peritrichatus TaxID=3080537 RepID=A0AAQ3QPS5_9BACT|nr:DEAD/DEAH box helicase [Puniceicoccus sp. CR14]WOO39398.1 DEAD/DEAH box helicase [Puniceicoccus sp. CR14]